MYVLLLAVIACLHKHTLGRSASVAVCCGRICGNETRTDLSSRRDVAPKVRWSVRVSPFAKNVLTFTTRTWHKDIGALGSLA